MFNRTVNVSCKPTTNTSTTVVNEGDKSLEIERTNEESKIEYCEVGSDFFKNMTSRDPYVKDMFKYKYGFVFDGISGRTREREKYLIYGAKVLQIKINGRMALIEYKIFEKKPKLIDKEFVIADPEHDGEWEYEEIVGV